MSYVVDGTVDTVFETQTVGQNGFKKRILWLKTNEQYSQMLEISFNQQNTDLLDGFSAGDNVKVTMGVGGRKSERNGEEKVFNSLNGFGIQRI